MALQWVVALCLLCHHVMGDIYLHMPRGSNNRLDEANRDRANGNRLFDSQNNNRGGYNVGSTYYTQGSILYSQWTAQHTCGAASNECEIIIQYMCDDWLRDGASTKRIPTKDSDCYEYNCDEDVEYGRHESQDWWYNCSYRERNKGLFTANQNLGHDATRTRQNPNGNRNGYECPEERDYYPYWYPTPWVDVAILTNSPTRCADYKAKSENVVGRWYCDPPAAMYEYHKNRNSKGWIPITEEKCLATSFTDEFGNITWANWVQSEPHNVPEPQCVQNWWSRDNSLGNIVGGYNSMFNWTMPTDFTHEQCAFRMRYNITTYDYDGWIDPYSAESGNITSSNDAVVKNNPERYPAEVPIWEDYGMTREEVQASFDSSTNGNDEGLKASREYVFKNNPDVDIFGELITTTPGELKLQMNINTAQFGRTFQDRSHRFALRENSPECEGLPTHNLQVRGKRGNIVQTFPGVEYDFVPEHLNMQVDECIHIQWTGSETNPNNNAGQGKQGTDRSNIVQLREPVYDEGQLDTSPVTFGQFGASFPAKIDDLNFLGFSLEDTQALAIHDNYGIGGEMSELDDHAGVYFDLGPKPVTQAGIYHYLCTRNNNFSNRSQKGKISVSSKASTTASVGWEGGAVQASSGAALIVQEGAFSESNNVALVTDKLDHEVHDAAVKSDFVEVYLDTVVEFTIEIPFHYTYSLFSFVVKHHDDPDMRELSEPGWTKQKDAVFDNQLQMATVVAEKTGVYVVVVGPLSLAGCAIFAAMIVVCLGVTLCLVKDYYPEQLSWVPNPPAFLTSTENYKRFNAKDMEKGGPPPPPSKPGNRPPPPARPLVRKALRRPTHTPPAPPVNV